VGHTLLQKVWDQHTVRTLPTGQTQLFIGLHLVHEVTTPQAFDDLRRRGWPVRFPQRTFATVDHIVPTGSLARPFQDVMAEAMLTALERNCRDFGIPLYDHSTGRQGIVHVIGPELGLTQPGMTIACGDSIGTSQVRDVLASQCLALEPLKVRRIRVEGVLPRGVYAKDVILKIIQVLGVKGGVGYAYEYAGSAVDAMSMDERMTMCNMSIEGGARVGYVNPDETTFAYMEGRPFAPQGEAFERAKTWWRSLASDADARYDDDVELRGDALSPVVTWGLHPGQSVGVDERVPTPGEVDAEDRPLVEEALQFMGFAPGQPIAGTPIDVAFVGSCTNSRLSDLREAAKFVKGHKVAKGVRAMVVPGSQNVLAQAEAEGLHEIFREAGFDWRGSGCSMCLGMNPDKLQGREMSASSSNRNFKGRQGSPTGRTLLMSPAMVAAAAIAGEVVDIRAFEPAEAALAGGRA
jgi:3-isopropylmalate/(R)-2-methylmalate dehydratase large subunit